ncbi:MAG TPA: LEA type 2 family protein [Chitinophagaceae bacterium]|nr:LEA type 2 family protein [Chitinophagaceae bacterium]
MRRLVGYALLILGLAGVIACGKPKQPEYIDFENVRVERLGLTESKVGVDVRFYNPNPFNIQLRSADFDVFFNDKFIGHSTLDTLIRIPKLDTFYIPVDMKVNIKDLMKNAVQLLLNPEVMIKVKGNAKVGKGGIFKNFPVDYEGKERIDVLMRDTALINLIK